ncbi:Fibulin-7 [Chelonia mydas]|uniref:Fibulin-7 n=1 Tax=Chelonia mydas TaxID=8469 RepID=M7B2M1_CHEMY|nr:Fibulin-7 [Chelonia mydas]
MAADRGGRLGSSLCRLLLRNRALPTHWGAGTSAVCQPGPVLESCPEDSHRPWRLGQQQGWVEGMERKGHSSSKAALGHAPDSPGRCPHGGMPSQGEMLGGMPWQEWNARGMPSPGGGFGGDAITGQMEGGYYHSGNARGMPSCVDAATLDSCPANLSHNPVGRLSVTSGLSCFPTPHCEQRAQGPCFERALGSRGDGWLDVGLYVDECTNNQHNCSHGELCVNVFGGYRCVRPKCPQPRLNTSYVKTSVYQCERNPCPMNSRACQLAPTSISFHYLPLQSNRTVPRVLFKMSTTHLVGDSLRFAIVGGRGQGVFAVQRSDRHTGELILTSPVVGPATLEVELEMSKLARKVLLGKHIFRVTAFISQSQF